MTKYLHLSKTDEWGTPQDRFNEWDKEFDFDFDPCANPNRLLKLNMKFLTKEQNGLEFDWGGYRVFVNPPYSKGNVEFWCKKCFEEKGNAELIVLLLPLTKASTKYFHEYVYPYAIIRLLKTRLNFIPLIGQKTSSTPVGSMLCIYRR